MDIMKAGMMVGMKPWIIINEKKEKKDMTNLEIYNIATNLAEAFRDNTQKLPVKVNFFLQKNKKTLIALAQEIEEARLDIAKKYGTLDIESGSYAVEAENVEVAQKDLANLFNIDQQVDIKMISYDDIDPDMELTTAQMEALLFMIE